MKILICKCYTLTINVLLGSLNKDVLCNTGALHLKKKKKKSNYISPFKGTKSHTRPQTCALIGPEVK